MDSTELLRHVADRIENDPTSYYQAAWGQDLNQMQWGVEPTGDLVNDVIKGLRNAHQEGFRVGEKHQEQ